MKRVASRMLRGRSDVALGPISVTTELPRLGLLGHLALELAKHVAAVEHDAHGVVATEEDVEEPRPNPTWTA